MARRWLLGAALAALGAALLELEPGPVPLSRQEFHVPAGRDDVYRRMTAFEPSVNVREHDETHALAEFPVQAGWYRTTTRERVALDPDHRRIVFEQLRSPFPIVQTATETFALDGAPGSGARVTLMGEIVPRLGLLGWLLTRWLVRPRWDRIDAGFLERVRRELAAPGP